MPKPPVFEGDHVILALPCIHCGRFTPVMEYDVITRMTNGRPLSASEIATIHRQRENRTTEKSMNRD